MNATKEKSRSLLLMDTEVADAPPLKESTSVDTVVVGPGNSPGSQQPMSWPVWDKRSWLSIAAVSQAK